MRIYVTSQLLFETSSEVTSNDDLTITFSGNVYKNSLDKVQSDNINNLLNERLGQNLKITIPSNTICIEDSADSKVSKALLNNLKLIP